MYVGPGSLEKKRNEKIAGKLQEQMEKESMRSGESKTSFCGNMGKPGTIFVINDVSFTVLNEKDAKGNRMVLC